MKPHGDDRNSDYERQDRPQTKGDLRLSEGPRRRPRQEAEELVIVRDVRAAQDSAGARTYEISGGDHLVELKALVQIREPREQQGCTQKGIGARKYRGRREPPIHVSSVEQGVLPSAHVREHIMSAPSAFVRKERPSMGISTGGGAPNLWTGNLATYNSA